jgi:adenylate cyclase
MAQEIERKFLVDRDQLPALSAGVRMVQGYIATASKVVVRVRIAGEQAFLTLKGPNRGAVRSEFEYPVPMADAEAMIEQLCDGPVIEKQRYLITHQGHTWELDVFAGDNQGLLVAEVELQSEHEAVVLPPWVSQEVTTDPRYYNVNLLTRPFKNW